MATSPRKLRAEPADASGRFIERGFGWQRSNLAGGPPVNHHGSNSLRPGEGRFAMPCFRSCPSVNRCEAVRLKCSADPEVEADWVSRRRPFGKPGRPVNPLLELISFARWSEQNHWACHRRSVWPRVRSSRVLFSHASSRCPSLN
jgi:hypothetical protein